MSTIQQKAMSKKFYAMVMIHKKYWRLYSHKPVDLLRRVATSITVLVASRFVNTLHSFTVNIREKEKKKINTKKVLACSVLHWPIPTVQFAVYVTKSNLKMIARRIANWYNRTMQKQKIYKVIIHSFH